MYIIRNKIRVICSKIRVGRNGGGPFSVGGWGPYFTGEYGAPGPYFPIEYGPPPGSIFRGGGSIFNMTPAHHDSGWIAS